MKKIKHFILIISLFFVTVFISGCVLNPEKASQDEEPIDIEIEANGHTSNCDELDKKVSDLSNKENYCDLDSDCVISTEGVHCCYHLINRNADLEKTNKALKKYYDNGCLPIVCDCMPIEQKDVKCVDNRCIACTGCPKYTPPAPNWCNDGVIIPPVEDECGCYGHPTCERNSIVE